MAEEASMAATTNTTGKVLAQGIAPFAPLALALVMGQVASGKPAVTPTSSPQQQVSVVQPKCGAAGLPACPAPAKRACCGLVVCLQVQCRDVSGLRRGSSKSVPVWR